MKKRIAAACFAGLFALGIGSQAAHAEYYVEKGDTFYKIAKEFDMSLTDLISLNKHITNPNKIKVGDYLVVRTGTETQKDLVDYARSLQAVTAYQYGGNNFPYETLKFSHLGELGAVNILCGEHVINYDSP